MRRRGGIQIALIFALALFAAWNWWRAPAPASSPAQPPVAMPDTRSADGRSAALPREALAVLQRIERNDPHPYRQDGGVFQNRERLLPSRTRGHYREYTVATPGSRDRGARRIVAGGDPPSEFYYSDDHYRSFRRIDARGRPLQPAARQ